MTSDANTACADMTLAAAIQDLSSRMGVTTSEMRHRLIESGAYDALYDESTGLWASGPDALVEFLQTNAYE